MTDNTVKAALSPEELQEIRERCEAATPGPWLPSWFGTQVLTGDNWSTVCEFTREGKDFRSASWEDGRTAKSEEANADFTAHARSDIPRLLDMVEALQAEIKEQARLNGMGAEREIDLRSKVGRLERASERAKEEFLTALYEAIKANRGCRLEATTGVAVGILTIKESALYADVERRINPHLKSE